MKILMLTNFFFYFQISNNSHTPDTEANITPVDTPNVSTSQSSNTHGEENRASMVTLPTPKCAPSTRKRKIANLSNMVSQLKEISETANSAAEENEFDVFGKLVGIKLKSLPLILALEAQEHIQVYLNRIRRKHIQNSVESTVYSPYTESPISNASSENFEEQQPQDNESFSVFQITPNDLIITAMQNAHDENETLEQTNINET